MTDDFDSKLERAHADLDAAGIWPSNYNPPIYRLFRKLGLQIRPPHYQNVLKQALSMGVIFGIIFGVVTTAQETTNIAALLWTAFVSGTLFGLFMAALTQIRRKQKGLSHWDDL